MRPQLPIAGSVEQRETFGAVLCKWVGVVALTHPTTERSYRTSASVASGALATS